MIKSKLLSPKYSGFLNLRVPYMNKCCLTLLVILLPATAFSQKVYESSGRATLSQQSLESELRKCKISLSDTKIHITNWFGYDGEEMDVNLIVNEIKKQEYKFNLCDWYYCRIDENHHPNYAGTGDYVVIVSKDIAMTITVFQKWNDVEFLTKILFIY
jgi:hypothetical protein